MKYRYLSDEELSLLEKEFIEFLIVNGIDGQKWQEINEQSHENALKLVGLFSDVVIERSLEKIQYGEYLNNEVVYTFRFKEDEVQLFGLRKKHKSAISSEIQQVFHDLNENPEDFEIFTQSKAYHPDRSQELFKMIQQGLKLSDGSYFKILKNLYHE